MLFFENTTWDRTPRRKPERVVGAIVHVLTSNRPKTRYLVLWHARSSRLSEWLPRRGFDLLARMSFRDCRRRRHGALPDAQKTLLYLLIVESGGLP